VSASLGRPIAGQKPVAVFSGYGDSDAGTWTRASFPHYLPTTATVALSSPFPPPPSLTPAVAPHLSTWTKAPCTMSRCCFFSLTDRLALAPDGSGRAPVQPRASALHRELRLLPCTRYPVKVCEDRAAVREATLQIERDMKLSNLLAVDVAWWAPIGAGTPFGLVWAYGVFSTPRNAYITIDNATDVKEIFALDKLMRSLLNPPVACGEDKVCSRLAMYGWADNPPMDLAVVAAGAEKPVRPWNGIEAVLRTSRGEWTDDGGDARMAGIPCAARVPRFIITAPQQTLLATCAFALIRTADAAGICFGSHWERSWTSRTSNGYVADIHAEG